VCIGRCFDYCALTMFPPTDNPAQRLLDILNQARPMQNTHVIKIWAGIFGFKEDDFPACYRALGHLNGLVDSIETRIRQLPDLKHDLYLRDLPTIRSVLCPVTLQQNWSELKRPLDQGVLTGLEFCANELSKNHEEDPIPEEELQKLRAEFANIFKDVSNAEISSNLKLILFDLLGSAILAIDQYKILGNDGIKKSVAYMVGMLTLHQQEFLAAKREGLVKRALAAVNRLGNAVTVASRVKEIAESVPELLRLLN
jgi:hypothetical protein